MVWKPDPIARENKLAHKEIVPGGGPLGRRNEHISDEEARNIGFEVIESCKLFNSTFASYGLPFRFDTSKLEAQLEYISHAWKATCLPVKEGKFKGAFCREHVLTVSVACFQYFHQKRDLLIWGACQGTKTMVFVGCFLLLPVLERIFNGRIAIPIINVPNSKNLQLGTLKELSTVAKLYADVDIVDVENDDNRISLSYVKTDILDKVLAGHQGEKDWNNLVIQRNAANLSAFIDTAKEECVTINFIDEIHHGSSVDSIIDRWEKDFLEKHPHGFRRIGITATPSEIWGLDHWVLIKMWAIDNFVGLIQYNRMTLPTISGKIPKAPELIAIEDRWPEFARKFLNTKKLLHEDYFAKSLPKHKWANAQITSLHEEFWQEFAEATFKIYKSLVDKQFPIFFFRPFDQTVHCENLRKRLEAIAERKENEGYKVLRYFGAKLDDRFGTAKTTPRTIKEVLLDEFVARDQFCMVIAGKGRSRMGDSYPKQTKHFMDLVDNSCCWDTIIQYTIGRSMGIGKCPVCHFRRSYVESYKQFVKNGCLDQAKKFGSRTDYADERGQKQRRRGRPSTTRRVVFPNAAKEE